MSRRPTLIAVPGLFWPSPGLRARLSKELLPGLQRLLADARASRGAARSFDTWLCALFAAGELPDIAGLRLAGEDELPPSYDGNWLCADPVHLHFARDQLLLRPLSTDEVTLDEAQTLVASLNREFADLGQFFAATPTRWYVTTPHSLHVDLPSLADVAGRPVAYFQPEGEDRARWARAANELQVFCHNHPVNAAREARGQAAINGLWLWGNGEPGLPRAPATQASGNAQPLLLGLCRSTGVDWRDSQQFDADTPLQFFTGLLSAVQARDENAWLRALHELDRTVFSPLAEALFSRGLPDAQLVAPGDGATLALALSAPPRWRFWRRHASMTTVASLLCAEPLPIPAAAAQSA